MNEPTPNALSTESEAEQYKIDLSFAMRSNPDYPPLDVAVREQLGLALREPKGGVDLLIVDSIEKPTAN